MRTITLADDSVYEVSRCGADGGYLWINLTSPLDMVEAVNIFADPEKTATIVHDFDGNDHVIFEGYTKLSRISDLGGIFEVVLQRVEESDDA